MPPVGVVPSVMIEPDVGGVELVVELVEPLRPERVSLTAGSLQPAPGWRWDSSDRSPRVGRPTDVGEGGLLRYWWIREPPLVHAHPGQTSSDPAVVRA
jgi:hypothetical protein